MKHRTGFTLIEMLVVVMIITMLAGMTLSAVGSARNAAAAARTRATIEKINRVVMKRYASYQYRKIDTSSMTGVDQNNKAAIAKAKLKALRALIRHEMPDRAGDLNAFYGETLPAVTQMYKTKFSKSSDTSHAAAELLYMQVMADPIGSSMFSEGEVGDNDKDGLPEFIDGWGRPIRYILWPAGFFRTQNNCETELQVTTVPTDPKFIHDPFDTANTEPGTPALFPLIYSAGPDGIYDINRGTEKGNVQNTSSYSIVNNRLDPMQKDGDNRYIGLPWNDTDGNNTVLHHYDNITNHSMITNAN